MSTYLASLEDLTLKVTGISSAVDSSAMVGLGVALKEDVEWVATRVCKLIELDRLNGPSTFCWYVVAVVGKEELKIGFGV